MKQPAACHVCGGALRTRFRAVRDPLTSEAFAVAECESCGLGHTVAPADDLARYYGDSYHGGRHGLTAALCAWRRLLLVNRAAGGGAGRRLLDVGCGDGTFLLAARRKGWAVTGTELNPRLARAAGLDVRATLDDARAQAPFDCVTLWHSLEHMADPAGLLKSLSELLAPDGVLLIAVPDGGGLQARVFGPNWFHLDAPRHLYHFDRRSLTYLLRSAGFVTTRLRHQEFEYDLLGWSQSVLNTLMPTPNVFFNLLTGRASGGGPARAAANCLLGLLFSALALPLTFVGALLRRGGTLVAVARRKSFTGRQYGYA
jgi:SAM-dependent methyltransferase